MEFVQPHFLWLLPLVAAFAWWQRRRKRAALRFPHGLALRDLPAGKARRAKRFGFAWRLAILVLLILALSRPRWRAEGTRIPVQSLALVMVLDVSGSMGERDFPLGSQPITRLDAAKHAFRLFVRGGTVEVADRADTLIGLVTFAARSEDVCPPTLSHGVVLRMLDGAQPIGTPPDSTTNIGDALVEGLELLRHARPHERVLVLLSDGEHNVPADVVPDARKPREAARLAQPLGVRIHTVYVGSKESTPEGELALRDVASITDGQFFRANDTETLVKVCQDLDRLERTRVESFQFYRYQEAYPWLGLACVVFYMGMGLWEGTRWLRIP